MCNGYQPIWSVDFRFWEVVFVTAQWKEEEDLSIALYNTYPVSH